MDSAKSREYFSVESGLCNYHTQIRALYTQPRQNRHSTLCDTRLLPCGCHLVTAHIFLCNNNISPFLFQCSRFRQKKPEPSSYILKSSPASSYLQLSISMAIMAKILDAALFLYPCFSYNFLEFSKMERTLSNLCKV